MRIGVRLNPERIHLIPKWNVMFHFETGSFGIPLVSAHSLNDGLFWNQCVNF